VGRVPEMVAPWGGVLLPSHISLLLAFSYSLIALLNHSSPSLKVASCRSQSSTPSRTSCNVIWMAVAWWGRVLSWAMGAQMGGAGRVALGDVGPQEVAGGVGTAGWAWGVELEGGGCGCWSSSASLCCSARTARLVCPSSRRCLSTSRWMSSAIWRVVRTSR
jgi:hypothetical protein